MKELLRRKQASESIGHFAEYVLDLELARHHNLICSKLDDIVDGRCKRLLINAPPGSAKSTYVSLLLPPYWMAKKHSLVLTSSHTQELADAFGRKVKNLITHEKYGHVFPDTRLSAESRAAHRFSCIDGGEYFGVGVEGGIAGRRAGLFIIDDPYKSKQDARSDTIRNRIKDWVYADVMPRLLPGAPIVIIHTRWHPDDISGHIIRSVEEGTEEKWEMIILPAICEREYGDPIHRSPGEALWPEWQDLTELMRIKRGFPDPHDWLALYQQHPVDPEGEVINRNWVQYYDKVPDVPMIIVNSWDTAGTVGPRSAYSCCLVIGITPNRDYYLLDVYRKRIEYPALLIKVPEMYYATNATICFVEDKGTGQTILQHLKGRAMNLVACKPQTEGDKLFRFEASTAVVQARRFFLPKFARWKDAFEEEFFSFPNSRFKDQADAFSQAINKMETRGQIVRGMAKLTVGY